LCFLIFQILQLQQDDGKRKKKQKNGNFTNFGLIRFNLYCIAEDNGMYMNLMWSNKMENYQQKKLKKKEKIHWKKLLKIFFDLQFFYLGSIVKKQNG
jgi:hypothetical protein